MVAMHVQLSLLFENLVFWDNVKKPSSFFQILLTSLLNAFILEIKLLPNVVKFIEHFKACLILVTDQVALRQNFFLDLKLALKAWVRCNVRQSLAEVSEGVDKIIDSKKIILEKL